MSYKDFRKISISSIIGILFSLTAFAQNTFYYSQYKHWSSELENKAAQGDVIAIVSLGSCYDRGDGVEQNREKAFKLFEQAYKKNSDPLKLGAYNMALYYARGYVTPIDYSTSEKLLKEVISNDSTFGPAFMTLAPIYEKGGYGVDRSDKKAFNTWCRLARLGDAIGQLKTGAFYKDGIGTDHNLQKAEDYFRLSAKQENQYAQYELANLLIKKEKYDEAINLLEQSGLKGFNVAYHNLGDLYYNGKGVDRNYKKAYLYFTKGIGFSACKFRLALMYRTGTGTEKNESKANILLTKAAEEGLDHAQYLLGCDYYEGTYTRDYALAVKYLELALQSKTIPDYVKGDICRKLSACYRFGRGVTIDRIKADEFTAKGTRFGNPDSEKISEWLSMTTVD